ncbi:Rho guanine nucleotide exchange factor 38 [Boothiomyces sp. JEL0866]|nr:Rho guanine nucleotide exchange factor 38 [Boothiomyces sp. JEL0866]KAJ3324549.1 Rho guanine nucleotide exchange factor 38 [Boothiomyces sp. JEL0866]
MNTINLKIGDYVEAPSSEQPIIYRGKLKYLGPVHFSRGIWAGIDLIEKGTGIFVPVARVKQMEGSPEQFKRNARHLSESFIPTAPSDSVRLHQRGLPVTPVQTKYGRIRRKSNETLSSKSSSQKDYLESRIPKKMVHKRSSSPTPGKFHPSRVLTPESMFSSSIDFNSKDEVSAPAQVKPKSMPSPTISSLSLEMPIPKKLVLPEVFSNLETVIPRNNTTKMLTVFNDVKSVETREFQHKLELAKKEIASLKALNDDLKYAQNNEISKIKMNHSSEIMIFQREIQNLHATIESHAAADRNFLLKEKALLKQIESMEQMHQKDLDSHESALKQLKEAYLKEIGEINVNYENKLVKDKSEFDSEKERMKSSWNEMEEHYRKTVMSLTEQIEQASSTINSQNSQLTDYILEHNKELEHFKVCLKENNTSTMDISRNSCVTFFNEFVNANNFQLEQLEKTIFEKEHSLELLLIQLDNLQKQLQTAELLNQDLKASLKCSQDAQNLMYEEHEITSIQNSELQRNLKEKINEVDHFATRYEILAKDNAELMQSLNGIYEEKERQIQNLEQILNAKQQEADLLLQNLNEVSKNFEESQNTVALLREQLQESFEKQAHLLEENEEISTRNAQLHGQMDQKEHIIRELTDKHALASDLHERIKAKFEIAELQHESFKSESAEQIKQKEVEHSSLANQLSLVNSQLEQLQLKNSFQQKEIQEYQECLDSVKHSLQLATAERDQLKTVLDEKESHLNRVTDELKHLNTEKETVVAKIIKYEQQIKVMQEENSSSAIKIEKLDSENNELAQSKVALEKILAGKDNEIQNLTGELQDTTNQLSLIKKTRRQSFQLMEAENHDLANKMAILKQENEDLLHRLDEVVDEKTNTVYLLQNELQACQKKLDQANASRTTLDSQFKASLQKFEDLERQSKAEIKNKQEEMAVVSQELEKYKLNSSRMIETMNEMKIKQKLQDDQSKTITALQEDLIQYKKTYDEHLKEKKSLEQQLVGLKEEKSALSGKIAMLEAKITVFESGSGKGNISPGINRPIVQTESPSTSEVGTFTVNYVDRKTAPPPSEISSFAVHTIDRNPPPSEISSYAVHTVDKKLATPLSEVGSSHVSNGIPIRKGWDIPNSADSKLPPLVLFRQGSLDAAESDLGSYGSWYSEGDPRSNILNEIVMSERQFLNDLQLLVSIFVIPSKDYIRPKDHTLLFGNVYPVRSVSEKLLSQMEYSLANTENIGNVFVDNIPLIESAYTAYCQNFTSALEIAEGLTSSNSSKITTFIKQSNKKLHGKTTSWDLNSLLIKPVQRVLKYPLLLKRLLEETPASHPDYRNIQKSLALIGQVAESINKATDIQPELKKRGSFTIMRSLGRQFKKNGRRLSNI